MRMRGTTQELDARARELRANLTHEEAMLWERLRARQLEGFKFRRQHPLGTFILDFCCAAARLVIEVDGDSHFTRTERDQARDQLLAAYGYRVLRFRNERVRHELEQVVTEIRTALQTAP